MKVMHLIGGRETGGSKSHLLPLLKEMNSRLDVTLCVFEWGEIPEEAQEAGIKVVCLRQKTRYDSTVLLQLRGLIRDEDIKILHTHGARANAYGMFLKTLVPVKWVTTVHSDPFFDFMGRGVKGKLFTSFNVRALKKVDHCFSISKNFEVDLREIGLAPEKITTIFNGLSFDEQGNVKMSDTHIAKQGNRPFTILNVGRLHPVKGHKLLIDAFKKLLDETQSNSKLMLVGDGELKEELISYVDNLGLKDDILFLGYQKNVEKYYSMADVYVQSSVSEGFPLVLLESAKAKVPIISTNVGAANELIKDKNCGWLVSVNDKFALSHAMSEAFSLNSEQLKQMGNQLYAHASETYSLKRLVDIIVRDYKKMSSETDEVNGGKAERAGLFWLMK